MMNPLDRKFILRIYNGNSNYGSNDKGQAIIKKRKRNELAPHAARDFDLGGSLVATEQLKIEVNSCGGEV